MHWLSHWLGLDNASGALYLFWSGFFGDVTVFAAALTLLFKHNCHVKGCWRIARRQVDGTTLHVCHKHHPTDPPAASDLGAPVG